MAELKKILSTEEAEEAWKKTMRKMSEAFEAVKMPLPKPFTFDPKNFIVKMPPIGPTLLDLILEALVKSGKSMEDSSQKIIKLTAKIKTLTWFLVGLGILTIALMIFSFLKR